MRPMIALLAAALVLASSPVAVANVSASVKTASTTHRTKLKSDTAVTTGSDPKAAVAAKSADGTAGLAADDSYDGESHRRHRSKEDGDQTTVVTLKNPFTTDVADNAAQPASSSQSPPQTQIQGYVKANGHVVNAYMRTKADGTKADNLDAAAATTKSK